MLIERNPREHLLVRDIILKRNGYKSYEEFLSSDYWKSIKRKVKTGKYKKRYSHCWLCGSKEYIQLHHENYRWILTKFELRSIRSLCRCCHEKVHEVANQYQISYSRAFDSIKSH